MGQEDGEEKRKGSGGPNCANPPPVREWVTKRQGAPIGSAEEEEEEVVVVEEEELSGTLTRWSPRSHSQSVAQ